jgi:hypothetical protein
MVCRPQHLRSPDGPRRPAQTRHFARRPSPLGDSIRADQSIKACRSRSSSGLGHAAKTSSRRSAATSSSLPRDARPSTAVHGRSLGTPRTPIRGARTRNIGSGCPHSTLPRHERWAQSATSVRVLPKGDRYSQHVIPARGNPCGVRLRPQCSSIITAPRRPQTHPGSGSSQRPGRLRVLERNRSSRGAVPERASVVARIVVASAVHEVPGGIGRSLSPMAVSEEVRRLPCTSWAIDGRWVSEG